MYSKYNPGPRQRKVKSEKDLIKLFEKRTYKSIHGGMAKPVFSLQEDTRIHCDDNEYGDSFREYGFIKGSENWSDEDIKYWIDSEWIDIRSPYDCTGKIFTAYIGYHRNPNGIISFIHCKSLDI